MVVAQSVVPSGSSEPESYFDDGVQTYFQVFMTDPVLNQLTDEEVMPEKARLDCVAREQRENEDCVAEKEKRENED